MQGSLTCKHDEQPRLGGSQGVPCKSLTGSWPWQTRPSADELAGGRAGLGCRRGGERGGKGGELRGCAHLWRRGPARRRQGVIEMPERREKGRGEGGGVLTYGG